MTTQPIDALRRLRRLVPAACIAGMALTVCVLIGWFTDIASLKSVAPGLAQMKANTAIALFFGFAATALVGRRAPDDAAPKAAWICAALVAAIGAATLVEYAAGLDLGIDQLVVRDMPGGVQTPSPGRMGANTAADFFLVGAALMLRQSRLRHGREWAQVAAVMALGLTFAVLLGYLYSVTSLIGFSSYTPMAVHTVAAFMVLTLAILCLDTGVGFVAEIGAATEGGLVARRMLATLVIAIPTVGWIRLESQRAGLINLELGLALFTLVNIGIVGVVTTFITARLNRAAAAQETTRAAQRASDQRFRDLVEGSVQAIMVQRDLKPLFANEACARVFGFECASDFVAQESVEWALPPADRRRYLGYDAARQRGDAVPSIMEGEAHRRDGTIFSMYSMARLVIWDGAPATQVTLFDITEQKKVEEQLRHSQKMEAVGQLTGGMAHDFNNLLGIVIGNLDMLKSQLPAGGETAELADESLAAALSGAELTRRLLAFARRQPLAPQRVALNDLVAGTAKLLARTLGEKIEISLDLQRGTWPVVVDRAQLESALTNLATNARDAMPKGGRLAIATANRALDADYAADHPDATAGDYAVIEISDTGIGMPPEIQARVFEPFYTTKERGKGTGLGLSMVFGFLKQSGGHINVYSEPGKGTSFRLYLPRAILGESDVVEAPKDGTQRGVGETVLVVEDNAGLRRVVMRQLADLGYQAVETTNAAGAIQILGSRKVHVLFTDVVMPGDVDGFALASLVMDKWPATKVVLTSGFPESMVDSARDEPRRQLQLLSKPYRKTDLAAAIRRALDGAGAAKDATVSA